MILKPQGTAVDIQGVASALTNATLVSVVNTNTTAALIVNSNGSEVYLAAGERVLIEKLPAETLIATTGATTEVWATSVAFRN